MAKVSIILPVYNAKDTLRKAIDSVKAQTYDDYELIMIDDCSTDGTLEMEREIAKESPKFILIEQKENGGVAAARNTGLDRATGEYVRFLDADDSIPADSTKGLVDAAESTGADLVIGAMRLDKMSDNSVLPRYEVLCKQRIISKDNPDLVHTFSVCSKLFKKSIIDENNLRFSKYRHAEDGLFSMQYMVKAGIIAGYDGVAYDYFRPIAFEKKTTTQIRSKELLEDFLASSKEIRKTLKDSAGSLIPELDYRVLNTSLTNNYYRHIWQLDEGGEKVLFDNINEFQAEISEDQKRKLIESSKDLKLDKGYLTQSEMVNSPEVEIAISPELSMEEKVDILDSLYQQRLPFFVVYMAKADIDSLPPNLAGMKNIIPVDGETKEDVFEAGVYQGKEDAIICFMEEPLYSSGDTLINAVTKMKHRDLKMISGRVLFREEGLSHHADLTILSNSFFSVENLKKKDFHFKATERDQLNGLIDISDYNFHHDIIFMTDKSKDEMKEWETIDGELQEFISNKEKHTEPGIRMPAFFVLDRGIALKYPINQKKALYISSLRKRMGGVLEDVFRAKPKGFDARYDMRLPGQARSNKEFAALVFHIVTSKYIIVEGECKFLKAHKQRPGQRIIYLSDIDIDEAYEDLYKE